MTDRLDRGVAGEARQRCIRSLDAAEARSITGSDLDRLFVYGSLREGQTARSLVAPWIARWEAASLPGQIYALREGYPGYVDESGARGRVIGELLWLTDLPAAFAALDDYEGHEFARVVRQVECGGELVWSWIYVLADPDEIRNGTLIEHGDWARLAPQR